MGAVVVAEKLDGTRVELTIGPEGYFTVKEVPLGILKVTIVSWKGVPIGYTVYVTPRNATITCPKIHMVTVRVVGARGQGLEGASVSIYYNNVLVERGSTDSSGVFKTLLPEETYKLRVEYGGKKVETSLESPGTKTVGFDVFIVLAGWQLSTTEFIGLIVLTAIIIVMIIVISYEYMAWRRRRLVKTFVK